MRRIVASFVFAAFTTTASALDYITLSKSSATTTIPKGSLIEIAGFATGTTNQEFGGVAKFTLANGDTFRKRFSGVWSSAFQGRSTTQDLLVGNRFMDVISIELEEPETEWGVLTVKITPKSELNSATPSTVLVVPENSTGNFTVVVEASDDLVKWEAFSAQAVNSKAATKFFRTRIIKNSSP